MNKEFAKGDYVLLTHEATKFLQDRSKEHIPNNLMFKITHIHIRHTQSDVIYKLQCINEYYSHFNLYSYLEYDLVPINLNSIPKHQINAAKDILNI